MKEERLVFYSVALAYMMFGLELAWRPASVISQFILYILSDNSCCCSISQLLNRGERQTLSLRFGEKKGGSSSHNN